MKLETKRLYLRELTENDFLADSDIMQHYPYTFDENRVRKWIAKNIERYTISYHVKCEIPFLISSKQNRKMTCEKLMKELHELGYTEIYTEKIADLVTGWIHKDGSVEYVLVNGKTKYRKGDMFDYDIKIVIAYHIFAKKI